MVAWPEVQMPLAESAKRKCSVKDWQNYSKKIRTWFARRKRSFFRTTAWNQLSSGWMADSQPEKESQTDSCRLPRSLWSRTCRRLSTVALIQTTTQMVYCKNCKIWWTNIYSSEQIPARYVRFDATASNTKHVALASSDVKNAWKLAPSFWHTSCKDQCQYPKRSEQGSVLKRLPKLASSIAESFCELYITYWLNSSNRENVQSDRKSAPVRQDNVPVLRKIANNKLESPYALVVRNADQTSTSPCEVSTQRWLATANGALRVWFVPLAKDLPKPVIHESEAPAAEEHIPIRITAY